jgi:hypothetical protein
VSCANQYSVGGNIINLLGSTGMVLRNNDANGQTIAFGTGTYSYTGLASGSDHAITVFTQPTNPWQTCTVAASGTGTNIMANVANAHVTCTTNTYFVGVNVTGLTMGSNGVTLANGADTLMFTMNGMSNFATKVASGAGYDVTVMTQPTAPAQVCSVSMGMASVAGTDVLLNVSCI